jgi:hypothetical protein
MSVDADAAAPLSQQVQLFRSMQAAEDGMPVVGPTARTLGARPRIDILVDPHGTVRPGTGGLSVSPDDPRNLPSHRRPPEFGGTGKDTVWTIASSELGPELIYRPDPLNPTGHGFVEPAWPMHVDQYQRALAATRGAWALVAP